VDDITVATLRKNARESIRVLLREFKGRRFLDIRLFASNGVEEVATKSGIAIRPELIQPVREALEEAERLAKEKGML
jgi:hypothetical protein